MTGAGAHISKPENHKGGLKIEISAGDHGESTGT
jgi:hypothetical protein